MEGTTDQVVTAASTANSSEFLDSNFRYMLFSVVYSIFFVVGLLANVFVLSILQCLRKVKGMGEIGIYMTNLTIADLLFVCALPFWIGYYSRGGHWIYEEFLCRLTGSFFFINTYGTILFLGAISLNRYWAVTQPLNAAAWNHGRRGIIVSVLIWLCLVSSAIPSLPSEGTHTDKDNLARCFEGCGILFCPNKVQDLYYGTPKEGSKGRRVLQHTQHTRTLWTEEITVTDCIVFNCSPPQNNLTIGDGSRENGI